MMSLLIGPSGVTTFFPVLAVAGSAAVLLAKELQLSLGIYQTEKATLTYRKFSPVIEPLTAALEARVGRTVVIRLRIFATHAAAIDALVGGEIDFARFGPASYVKAKAREAEIALLAMEQKNGSTRSQGVVVAAPDSPVQGLADLKGRRFAFGDENSTVGRYLAQAELVRAGLHAGDLAAYEYLGQHNRVAKAVVLGDFDAGVVDDDTYEQYGHQGKLRAIHQFDTVTTPWIARAGMHSCVLGKLRASLVALSNEAALKALRSSGFVPGTDAEYDSIRNGIESASRFFPSC